MSFLPDETKLKHVQQLLETSIYGTRNSSGGIDNETHRKVQQEVDSNCSNAEFSIYLTFIFTNTSSDTSLRYMAGLVLRKSVSIGLTKNIFLEEHIDYIKSSVVRMISESDRNLRKAAANLTATIARQTGLKKWPSLLQSCVTALNDDNSSEMVVEGVLTILSNLIEDCVDELSDPLNPGNLETSPLVPIFPRLVLLSSVSHTVLARKALQCLNKILGSIEFSKNVWLIMNKNPSFSQSYLQTLSQLTNSENSEIKREVCSGLSLLLATNLELVAPHVDNISNFMANCLISDESGNDESVKIEACEFLVTLSAMDSPIEQLNSLSKSALLKLIQSDLIIHLLRSMSYSDDELILLGTESENSEDIPDRLEDIKPRFHSSQSRSSRKRRDSDVENDDEVISGGSDSQDYTSMWTLRKASAELLDSLASIFPEQVMSKLMPQLEQHLSPNSSWKTREASILALGAVAIGCDAQLRPNLAIILPFLVTQIKDDVTYPSGEDHELEKDYGYLVRLMSCWTLSRFSRFLAKSSSNELKMESLSALLMALRDKNKKVQTGACSALAECEETFAQTLTSAQVSLICIQLIRTFHHYIHKTLTNNLTRLLDAISTLFESFTFDESASSVQAIKTVMETFLSHQHRFNIEDGILFVFLDCMNTICQSTRMLFAPFAKLSFEGCSNAIELTLDMIKSAHENNFSDDEVSREALVSALDFCSTLLETFKDQFEALVQSSSTSFPQLLTFLLNDSSFSVRQVLFGLIGDVTRFCPKLISDDQTLRQIAAALMKDVYPVNEEAPDVSSNAIWALGQMVIGFPAQMQPALKDVATLSAVLMQDESHEEGILENAAIAFGRVGLVAKQELIPHLRENSYPFLAILAHTQAHQEKVEATRGFIGALIEDPTAVVPLFPHLWYFVVNFPLNDATTADFFKEFLKNLRNKLNALNKWEEAFNILSDEDKNNLNLFIG